MGIVNQSEAAIAQAAAIQQAVQAVVQVAPAVAALVPATITNDPVVLPATGAAPEQAPQLYVKGEAALNPGVAPLAVAGGADTSATTVTQGAEPTTAPSEPGTPLTKAGQLQTKIDALTKRIDADTKKREELAALLRSVDLLDGIKAGSVIVARVGRAETSKEVTASVVGVQTLENGDKRFKIYYGEGFDADTVVIQESQILDVRQV